MSIGGALLVIENDHARGCTKGEMVKEVAEELAAHLRTVPHVKDDDNHSDDTREEREVG
jgi:hypothetical protein